MNRNIRKVQLIVFLPEWGESQDKEPQNVESCPKNLQNNLYCK